MINILDIPNEDDKECECKEGECECDQEIGVVEHVKKTP